MTTPEITETPPAAAPPAPASAGAEAAAPPAAPEGSAHDSTPEGAPADAAAGEAAPGEGGERKRRRRRRRKKGGAQAQGAEAGAEGATEGAEGSAEGAEGASGTAASPGTGAKKKRPRDRERRPPREGGFHVGDLIFGRILDINEDAVLIDLSGKGLALFDKAEVDLPDDPVEAAKPSETEGVEDPDTSTETAGALPEAAASTDVAPTPVEARPEAAPPGEATAGDDLTGDRTTVVGVAPEARADGAEAPAEVPAVAPKPPPAPLPPLVLEEGGTFVGYVHNDGGRGGLVVVTRHPKRASRMKPQVAAAFHDKTTTVKGLVTGVIKGGVEVDVQGLRAFTPGSHMDVRPGADLTPFLGRRLDFLVTQYAKRGRDVVLSRKPFIEAEAKANREAALAKLQVGSVVEGVVRSVVSFGAFIDVGGVEGLVPLQEMSHNRGDAPGDVFKAGETVPVKITKVDERGKVWLSRRATMADPWMELVKKYAQGTKHTGKVVRILPFGAFVELEAGIDGLVHVSDLSFKRIEKPEDVVKVGDEINVVVSHVDAQGHRIALHPAPTGEAADEAPQRVQMHKPVKVVVALVEAGGLVVRIRGATGRAARGFITAAATGTPRGTELRKLFPVGKELEAKVIDMDPKRGEIKLSIKALNEDTERSAYAQYRQQVSRDAKFTFADLIAKKAPQAKS